MDFRIYVNVYRKVPSTPGGLRIWRVGGLDMICSFWPKYWHCPLVFSINMKNWPFLDDLPRKLLKKKTMFNGYVRLPVAMLFGGTDK